MRKIDVYLVGEKLDGYLLLGVEDYRARISKYLRFDFIYVRPENRGGGAVELKAEAGRLLPLLEKKYVIALDLDGKQMDSQQLADHLEVVSSISSNVAFVIGSSHGLDETVKKRADLRLSFSRFTFPHQLMSLILCEQLFRALTIINHHPYHK